MQRSPAIKTHVAAGAQRVNEEPGKIVNLFVFVYFFRKLAETFNKLQCFIFQ